jgi:hypothetical protein
MNCPKYDLKVTGCSKQFSLFKSEICEACVTEAKEKGTRENVRRETIVRKGSVSNLTTQKVGLGLHETQGPKVRKGL